MIKIETNRDYQESIHGWAAIPRGAAPLAGSLVRLIFLKRDFSSREILAYAYQCGILVDITDYNAIASIITFVGHIEDIY